MKEIVRRLKSVLGFSKNPAAGALSFDLMFQYFREVLDSKNRALEIIADMGEKLGGDYLFDIVYIRNTYAELYASMKDSLLLFDNLTQDKYAQINDVFARIDRQVRLMVDGAPMDKAGQVILHQDLTWDMARAVGGKNASLAELRNYANINVPDGFAITTQAFDEFITYNGLSGQIQALGDDHNSQRALSGLHDAIMSANMPPELVTSLDKALEKIREKDGDTVFLAVRSSAEEEDSEHSFAGQFETVLNVPLDQKAVHEAYKRVVASLYSPKAIAYQKMAGYDLKAARMAVCCLVMVDAASSGVAYSTDPSADPTMGADTMIINSAWGLGQSIVEGQVDADMYIISKQATPLLTDKKIGNKTYMVTGKIAGGTDTAKVPVEMAQKSSLTDEQVVDIARQVLLIEKYFRKPVDVEWAIDRNGTLFILQARPLRVIAKNEISPTRRPKGPAGSKPLNVLLKNKGPIVQKGFGAGRVFVLKHMEDLANFPKGAILVARNDSSEFIRAIPYASAIITDVGTPTSHMSSLCREFRVPAIVNAGNATKILKHGQEITVVIEDEGSFAIYEGTNRDMMERADTNFSSMDDVYEFRKKRYILRYISLLNLIDPLMDNFTPDGCRTMHDILRFIHEKSVAELVNRARYGNDMLKKHAAIRLNVPVPLGIVVIDIGGGLTFDGKSGSASLEQIASVPLFEIIRGMTYPGVWQSEITSLRVSDFMSSMMRMPDITTDTNDRIVYNIAIASKEYVNLSLRLGYHFNMIDCYCSDNTKNNHIYFRFVGGATDITKRSRRVQLIADILKEFGFNINIKGDLIVGRLANIQKSDMENVLNQLGRLIGYTRQLDALLHDDAKIETYVRNFLEGKYNG